MKDSMTKKVTRSELDLDHHCNKLDHHCNKLKNK